MPDDDGIIYDHYETSEAFFAPWLPPFRERYFYASEFPYQNARLSFPHHLALDSVSFCVVFSHSAYFHPWRWFFSVANSPSKPWFRDKKSVGVRNCPADMRTRNRPVSHQRCNFSLYSFSFPFPFLSDPTCNYLQVPRYKLNAKIGNAGTQETGERKHYETWRSMGKKTEYTLSRPSWSNLWLKRVEKVSCWVKISLILQKLNCPCQFFTEGGQTGLVQVVKCTSIHAPVYCIYE